MIRKLVKHGDDLALVVDRPFLELLGIDEHSALDIVADRGVLMVSKAKMSESRSIIEQAMAGIHSRYGQMFLHLSE